MNLTEIGGNTLKPESTEDHRVWHSGPPPWIGWVNASVSKLPSLWRWHHGNGRYSAPVYAYRDADTAGEIAKMKDITNRCVLWTDYWPEDGRVTREQARGKS